MTRLGGNAFWRRMLQSATTSAFLYALSKGGQSIVGQLEPGKIS
jgi:hypothetical protein